MLFKYFVLKEELFKRDITLSEFATALGVATPTVSGNGAPFPLEKLDLAVELLNNWTGPTKARRPHKTRSNIKLATREMFID